MNNETIFLQRKIQRKVNKVRTFKHHAITKAETKERSQEILQRKNLIRWWKRISNYFASNIQISSSTSTSPYEGKAAIPQRLEGVYAPQSAVIERKLLPLSK
jgi:hypothetical protein